MLRHDFSLSLTVSAPVAPSHYIVERPDRIRQRSKEILLLLGFFYFNCRIRRCRNAACRYLYTKAAMILRMLKIWLPAVHAAAMRQFMTQMREITCKSSKGLNETEVCAERALPRASKSGQALLLDSSMQTAEVCSRFTAPLRNRSPREGSRTADPLVYKKNGISGESMQRRILRKIALRSFALIVVLGAS